MQVRNEMYSLNHIHDFLDLSSHVEAKANPQDSQAKYHSYQSPFVNMSPSVSKLHTQQTSVVAPPPYQPILISSSNLNWKSCVISQTLIIIHRRRRKTFACISQCFCNYAFAVSPSVAPTGKGTLKC